MKIFKTLYNIAFSASFAVALINPISSKAQEVIEIQPIFEYPQAPEELTSIQAKSDYLMDHFWDALDVKSLTAFDQNAVNHAFKTYVIPMRFADKNKAIASVDKLIEKTSKNITLTYQLMRAAEENLYSPRSEVWIDDVYMRFLQSFLKNKKIPSGRKGKYEKQLSVLEKTGLQSKAPEFSFTSRDGNKAKYFPMSTPTLIIFGDPTLTEWRMIRMKLETDLALSDAVDKGKVNIIFIITRDIPGWEVEIANYPKVWTVGNAPDIFSIYDIRVKPSFYVIDSDGKIAAKNVTPSAAVDKVLSLISK